MSSEKSLKDQNQHLIIAAIVIHAVIFIGIALKPLETFNLSKPELFEHLKKLIAPGSLGFTGILIATLLLRGLLPSLWRDRLVHWRWHNPLPGSRAFTVIGPKDARVNMQSLNSRYGPLPTDPAEQETRFYAIYKEHQDAVGVRDAHKSYLALRDIAVITFLFTPALPLAAYVLTGDHILAFKYLGALFLAFVVISWAAKTYAARLIENTLSTAS